MAKRARTPTIKLTTEQSEVVADCDAKTTAGIAGTGGGKTLLGMIWLGMRLELFPNRTWAMAEPTYQMLEKIIVNSPDPDRPDLLTFLTINGFEPHYKAVAKIIETNKGKVYLGSADKPNSMQGAAVAGYWLDEAGMMALEAYQTALQRVAFQRGQVLITSTPYNRGWLKTEIWDKRDSPLINARRWRSIDNPVFPKESYYEMRSLMSTHRWEMMFNASFERPEGLIYHDFDDDAHVIVPFKIPRNWPRYVGMDFGPVNTVALWVAREPKQRNPRTIVYREYHQGGMTTHEHAKELLRLSKGEKIVKRIGGAYSEDQWRRDLSEGGWYVERPPIKDVERGIDRVIGMHKSGLYLVFNTCAHYLDEKANYARVLDENQLPTDKIANKEKFHVMDAERYIDSYLTHHRACAFEY